MGWIDDLVVKLSGGYFSVAGLLNVSSGSIVTEKDKFITSKGVTKVVQVTQMPYHYEEELITVITKAIKKVDPSIGVSTYIEAERCTIPINHPTYIQKQNKAVSKYEEVATLFKGLSDIHQKAGVVRHNGVSLKSFGREDLELAKNVSESYSEVRNNIRRNGGVYFLTRIYFHLTFKDNQLATLHYDALASMIDSMVRKSSKINKKMATYLLNMSPSVTNIQGITSTNVLTSESSLTNLIPYRKKGLVSTKGHLLGHDVDEKSPFYLDTQSTDQGSSILIAGSAGSGKTAFANHYSLQSIPNDTTVVYLDLKGGTVSKTLEPLMDNYEVVDFSGKNAKFINPLILDSVNRDYGMAEAITTTSQWLALMVDLQPNEGSSLDLDNLLKSAIRGYYSEMKVSEDNPETFNNSRTMELGKLVNYLGINKNQASAEEEIKIYNLAAKRISATLQEFNMERNTNAIDITKLYDRDAIVFDFNKDKEVTVDRIDVIRIFSVMFFTKQLSMFNKRNERFTVLMADEGNQYLKIKGLMSFISDVTARARSSNASVVFIVNDLSVVKEDEMSGFRSNIAVYMIGEVSASDIAEIERLSGSSRLVADVKRLNRHPGKYKYSFAVLSSLDGHKVNALVRTDLPPFVLKAFASRTVKLEES